MPRALIRGLTQTILWARRERRSISRPTTSGSPRSQPSERITTIAPRAIPRRPCRSLNSLSASPIRVPLDQSGAVAAARCMAWSGRREPSARVSRVKRVAKTKASACRPLTRGAAEELQVSARVGLHRAGDVAEHDQPAAQAPPPASRDMDRVAPGAQAAAQGVAQIDHDARDARPRSGACAAPGSPARALTSADRAERARSSRACRSACRRAAPRHWRPPPVSRARRARRNATAPGRRPPGLLPRRPAGCGPALGQGRSSAGAGSVLASSGATGSLTPKSPKTSP